MEILVRKILTSFFVISISLHASTVVIDPGHGGNFLGTSGINTKQPEKDITLNIAVELSNLLEKNKNINVILTRNSDKHLHPQHLQDLQKRIDIATQHNAHIFISIHLNASQKEKTARGFEVYVPWQETPNHESYKLATFVHHELAHTMEQEWQGTLGNLNVMDRGIRQARFTVLSKNTCPASILVELDYLSHPERELLITNQHYQLKLAAILSKALIKYLNSVQ